MSRFAKIPEIKKGVVFSDPWYGPDVWCQYRQPFHAKDWLMQLDSTTEDGILYFQLKLGRCTVAHGIQATDTKDGSFRIACPGRYTIKDVELGMDTACIFCGNMENWDTFGESGAIRTGTDGMFGDLMVFTCKGESDPAGFLLIGALDETFGREEDLFKHLTAAFNGQEITKALYQELSSPDSLQFQVCAAAELKHARSAETPQKTPDNKELDR